MNRGREWVGDSDANTEAGDIDLSAYEPSTLIFRCDCGNFVDVEEYEGDCEDAEVQCPGCLLYTQLSVARGRRVDA